MVTLKERCPNCGGTIILPPDASVGECDYCAATFSLTDLQKLKEGSAAEQTVFIGNEQSFNKNADLDIDGNDEISIEDLCKKIEIALESEYWQGANRLSNKILRTNPKFAKAYLYKLLAEHKVFKKEELINAAKPFNDSDNYRLLIRFADVYLKREIENYSKVVNARYQREMLESKYRSLCSRLDTASTEEDYQNLANGFHSLGNYKDSRKLASEYLNKFRSANRQLQAKEKMRKFFTVIIICVTALAIIGIPVLKKASYRASLFQIQVTDKVNVDYDDDTAYFVLKFNIINESRHNANYLQGYITISNAEGKVLASGSNWFRGAIASKNVNYHELPLELNISTSTALIWNTDFSDLVIKYRITEIHFEDGTIKKYTEEDAIVNQY